MQNWQPVTSRNSVVHAEFADIVNTVEDRTTKTWIASVPTTSIRSGSQNLRANGFLVLPPGIARPSVQFFLLFLFACLQGSPSSAADPTRCLSTSSGFDSLSQSSLTAWLESIDQTPPTPLAELIVNEPVADTVYPENMAAPVFSWTGPQGPDGIWLVELDGHAGAIRVLVDRSWWVPTKNEWLTIRDIAGHRKVRLSVIGVGGWSTRTAVSRGCSTFFISQDQIRSSITWVRKPLPFQRALSHPEATKLMIGDISSYEPPQTALTNQRTCFNCHTFSLSGTHFGMDMDQNGDKGSYVLKAGPGRRKVAESRLISWNNLPAPAPSETNMGLFASLSPSGRYVAATTGELSLFVMLESLSYSQLFFPVTGRISVYDSVEDRFFTLPGADDPDRVQTCPAWSPDGEHLVFASAPVNPSFIAAIKSGKVSSERTNQTIAELNRKYPITFDLYRIPFNDGKGGQAEPLAGAARNGASNFFPRFSPCGRWIVFTQSPTGLVLQPESRLYIMPAEGGEVRVLGCNLANMNSWHSWSSNGKWMVFSSKAQSPYTEIFLSHVDENGHASPGCRLFRFSSPKLAAMVPEFMTATTSIRNELFNLDHTWRCPQRRSSGP